MKDQYSRRDFLKNSAVATASTALSQLVVTNEARADPPIHYHTPNLLHRNPFYFGRHNSHGFGFYDNHHGGHLISHQGLLVQDLSLRMMLLGDHIRRQGREEKILRNSRDRRVYEDPRDCRIPVKPQKLPQTFVAYRYEDTKNNDSPNRKNVVFPDEFIGIDQEEYYGDKMITWGARLPISGVKGKTFQTRLYRVFDNGKKDHLETNKSIIPKDHFTLWFYKKPGTLRDKGGSGEYEIDFHIEDSKGKLRHWNTIGFEIVSSPKEFREFERDTNVDNYRIPNERKVIAEPLGIFEQRPK